MIVLCLLLGLRFGAGYFSSSHDTQAKTVAVQLASERIEKLKALPWASLGFYGDDAAPACTLSNCSSQSTVVLGATRPSGALAPHPSYQTTREALTYTVATFVTWPSASTPTNGPKHIVVRISWTSAGRTSSAVIDALRSPSYSEVAAGASTPTTAPTAPSTPAPTGPIAITSMTVSPSPVCVARVNNAWTTTKTESMTVTASNATPYDDMTITWPGNPTPIYNSPWGQGNSTAMNYVLTMPANTGLGTSTTPAPLTLTITRATDQTTATSSQTFSFAMC
jgi:hypothetical protein